MTTAAIHRPARSSAGRSFVRGVLQVNAVLMILPGAILFAISLVGAVTAIMASADTSEGAALVEEVAATSVATITMLGVSVMMMMFGALIYLGLYAEDHLFQIRRRPAAA